MRIYVVRDSDDRAVDSVWDEETFKKVYKNYLDKTGQYWHKIYDVVSYELNKDYENNDQDIVFAHEMINS